MKIFNIGTFLKITACSCILLSAINVNAQSTDGGTAVTDSTAADKLAAYKKSKEVKPERYSFKDMFAFRANMVDWVLMTPSIGIQFDLSPWDYNKATLGANFKYNPGSRQSFTTDFQYKMLDARLEFRKYFRESLTIKPGQKRMPKYWRAYYWGIYASYTDYEIYLKNGFSGKHFGLGGTFGWEIPLITMKNGGIDLDLGANIGWIYGESKKRIKEGDTYKFTNIKENHFTLYPILSEFRLALVYRFKSVKVKYNKSKR